MSREKFGAGETKLKEIQSTQSGGSESEDAGKSHKPQSIGSNSFFGGLMPFFCGLGIGFAIVVGGGALA